MRAAPWPVRGRCPRPATLPRRTADSTSSVPSGRTIADVVGEPRLAKLTVAKIAGVLGGAAQRRLLVKRVRGIGERRRPIAARLGFVEVRMEHDVRAAPRGPADRLRIAPALVADRDAERQRAGLEHAAPGARRVGALLRWIELHLVLEAGDRSVAVDDQRRDAAARPRRSRSVPSTTATLARPRRRRRRTRRARGTRDRAAARVLARRAIAGHEALRKADQIGVLGRGLGDGRDGRLDRCCGCLGNGRFARAIRIVAMGCSHPTRRAQPAPSPRPRAHGAGDPACAHATIVSRA